MCAPDVQPPPVRSALLLLLLLRIDDFLTFFEALFLPQSRVSFWISRQAAASRSGSTFDGNQELGRFLTSRYDPRKSRIMSSIILLLFLILLFTQNLKVLNFGREISEEPRRKNGPPRFNISRGENAQRENREFRSFFGFSNGPVEAARTQPRLRPFRDSTQKLDPRFRRDLMLPQTFPAQENDQNSVLPHF